jgi:uncharacterized protein HemY
LPNDAQIFELMGYIQRRQGHWEESTRNFERAQLIRPAQHSHVAKRRNHYDLLRRYHNEAATLDRALAVESKDTGHKSRAFVESIGKPIPDPCIN